MNAIQADSPESVQLGNDARIKNLVTAWAEAIRTKDVAAVTRHFIGHPVNFSLAPPLQEDGSLRETLVDWFATFDGPLELELRDLQIFAGDRAAWCRALARLAGTKTGGEKSGLWFRMTMGFQKDGEAWKIAHLHESVPFLMDGSDKAALDLQP